VPLRITQPCLRNNSNQNQLVQQDVVRLQVIAFLGWSARTQPKLLMLHACSQLPQDKPVVLDLMAKQMP